MRFGTICSLYFDTPAHMTAAQTTIRNAAAGWPGLDPTYANGGLVDDVHGDHYGGQFLNVVAVGTSAASVQQVFNFMTAQAVGMGAVSPNPPNQQTQISVRTVDDLGHITGGTDGVLSVGGTWTTSPTQLG